MYWLFRESPKGWSIPSATTRPVWRYNHERSEHLTTSSWRPLPWGVLTILTWLIQEARRKTWSWTKSLQRNRVALIYRNRQSKSFLGRIRAASPQFFSCVSSPRQVACRNSRYSHLGCHQLGEVAKLLFQEPAFGFGPQLGGVAVPNRVYWNMVCSSWRNAMSRRRILFRLGCTLLGDRGLKEFCIGEVKILPLSRQLWVKRVSILLWWLLTCGTSDGLTRRMLVSHWEGRDWSELNESCRPWAKSEWLTCRD